MPLFSVVIPVKDRSALLRRALVSLQAQSFRDFEVVIVDDGSQEDLSPVVSAFPDLAVRLVRQDAQVRGAGAARNLGSDVAQGAYIAYLDSDDVFLPAKLQVMAETIAESAPDLLASYLLVYRGDERLQLRPLRAPAVGERIDEFYFVADQRIQSSSIVILRELFERTRWNAALRKVQDPDFFIRASVQSSRMRFIDQPLAVLFDDALEGRISNAPAEDNLRRWLKDDACPLSERSKAGFRFYALSHEVSKRSRREALVLMLQNCHAVGLKTQLKTLYRLMVPEALFKRTAMLVHGNASSRNRVYWQQVSCLIEQAPPNV